MKKITIQNHARRYDELHARLARYDRMMTGACNGEKTTIQALIQGAEYDLEFLDGIPIDLESPGLPIS